MAVSIHRTSIELQLDEINSLFSLYQEIVTLLLNEFYHNIRLVATNNRG